jgi:hypothetical protein
MADWVGVDVGDFIVRQDDRTGQLEIVICGSPVSEIDPAAEKTCKKCGITKPLESFARNKNMKDGRLTSCRVCLAKEHKARLKVGAGECVDCGKKTSCKGYLRCKPCSDKHRKGENHPRYKGGRTITPRGYVYLSGYPDHPNAKGAGAIAEHVLVMSRMLGRPLTKDENVHHKNGIRHDNRPENLELWSRSQPPGQRAEDKVAWAREILNLYRPELLKEES